MARSSRTRRNSASEHPVPRRQSRRTGNAVVPVLITLVCIGLLAGGATVLSSGSTGGEPIDPVAEARAAVDDADQRAGLAVERLAFADAEQQLARARELAADPLLADQQEAIATQIATTRQRLACARAELAILEQARTLQRRLQDAMCEPDLDRLAAEVAAFQADPLTWTDAPADLPVSIDAHLSLVADADERLQQERQRRRTGLVCPTWPQTEDTSVAARSARRQFINAEKEVADCIAEGNYGRAFRYLQRCQERYDQVSFASLWTQIEAALQGDWPGIRATIDEAMASAENGDPEARASARRLLLDTIPRLGDEAYMARLRPLLERLSG